MIYFEAGVSLSLSINYGAKQHKIIANSRMLLTGKAFEMWSSLLYPYFLRIILYFSAIECPELT